MQLGMNLGGRFILRWIRVSDDLAGIYWRVFAVIPSSISERGRRYLAGRGNLTGRDLATIVMRSDAHRSTQWKRSVSCNNIFYK